MVEDMTTWQIIPFPNQHLPPQPLNIYTITQAPDNNLATPTEANSARNHLSPAQQSTAITKVYLYIDNFMSILQGGTTEWIHSLMLLFRKV